ncbi:hypothetical protein Tco_0630281 [Tanacetum coccineum]
MFDEYLNHSSCVGPQVPAVIAPEPTVSTEPDHDIEVAHMDNNPYVDFPIPEPSSEESSTQVVIPNNMEMEIPSSSNVKLVTECSDTTYTCYERSHKGVKASANYDIVYFFTSAQDGNTLQDDERLDLADDLMKAQVHNQRQILDSRGAIPSKTVADAKVAIQEMAEYYQKWHNGTSRSRSTKTSDGLAAIQAQLNNLGREIKKVNEKVYAAQVGCEQCKGPHTPKIAH